MCVFDQAFKIQVWALLWSSPSWSWSWASWSWDIIVRTHGYVSCPPINKWDCDQIAKHLHRRGQRNWNTCNKQGTTAVRPPWSGELMKPVNRIKIIMGKFGCTQIWTSSSCSSEKKKKIFIFLGGIWHILPRGLIVFAQKLGYRCELEWVFGSNVP